MRHLITPRLSAVLLALAFAAGLPPNAVKAAVIISLQESGGNVVATSSGTANLSALTAFASGFGGAINPGAGTLVTGANSGTAPTFYHTLTGPSSFGTGGSHLDTSGAGDFVGVAFAQDLVVTNGYVSCQPVSGTATWTGQTFSSLGITPGVYTWTWGSGATADSLTVATPEPVSMSFLAVGGMGLLARRRRRAL